MSEENKNDPAPKEEELTNDDLKKVSGGFSWGVSMGGAQNVNEQKVQKVSGDPHAEASLKQTPGN